MLCERWSTGIGYPEVLESSSEMFRIHLDMILEQGHLLGVGVGDLQRSLTTSSALRFCETTCGGVYNTLTVCLHVPVVP